MDVRGFESSVRTYTESSCQCVMLERQLCSDLFSTKLSSTLGVVIDHCGMLEHVAEGG